MLVEMISTQDPDPPLDASDVAGLIQMCQADARHSSKAGRNEASRLRAILRGDQPQGYRSITERYAGVLSAKGITVRVLVRRGRERMCPTKPSPQGGRALCWHLCLSLGFCLGKAPFLNKGEIHVG